MPPPMPSNVPAIPRHVGMTTVTTRKIAIDFFQGATLCVCAYGCHSASGTFTTVPQYGHFAVLAPVKSSVPPQLGHS